MRAIPFELRFAAYGGRMPTDIVQQADRAAETRSMIGEDLIIAGNVTSNGDLHVDGHIQGDVRCGSLVLGETSQIEGNVVADEVVIRGRLIGSVRGLRVTLQSTSHVEGDLVHKGLAMEQGAYFDGKSSCSDDPLPASKTAAVEEPSAKPPPTTERRELRSDKSTKAFIRSLPESRKA